MWASTKRKVSARSNDDDLSGALLRTAADSSTSLATKSRMMLHQTFDPICYQNRDEANHRVSLRIRSGKGFNTLNMDGKKKKRGGLVIRKGNVLGLKSMFFNKTCRFALQRSYNRYLLVVFLEE